MRWWRSSLGEESDLSQNSHSRSQGVCPPVRLVAVLLFPDFKGDRTLIVAGPLRRLLLLLLLLRRVLNSCMSVFFPQLCVCSINSMRASFDDI